MSESRNRAIRERAEMEDVKLSVDRLGQQVEGLVTAQEELNTRLDQLGRTRDQDAGKFKEDLAEVRQTMKVMQAAQIKMKKEIIGNLSGRITSIMETQQPPSGGGDVGRWHVVQQGETLSEIGRAYHVKVSAIVKANDSLKTEDSIIKIGQKIFIPE